jgi:hypothetical protein
VVAVSLVRFTLISPQIIRFGETRENAFILICWMKMMTMEVAH